MKAISEDNGTNITYKQIKAFYGKGGSIINIMLIILGTIMPNQFTTVRWVWRQLFKCDISVSKNRVSANITHLKKKQGYIKAVQYDNYGLNLIDLNVEKKAGKGSKNPITMIALGKEGRKQLKKFIKENSECFED